MIPDDWIAHHREDDGELLGYLRPVDGGFEPVTVFGHPLGGAGHSCDAAAVLDAIGLSYLAERWLLTVPGWDEPIAVQVVEADPDHVRVKSVDHRYDGDAFFILPVPVSGLQPQH